MFNLEEAFKKSEEKSGGSFIFPEGEYDGFVDKATLGKTTAGHAVLKLELLLADKGSQSEIDGAGKMKKFFHDINLEHPKCKEISHQTVATILVNGIENAPKTIATNDDLVRAMPNVPVSVKVKHKGANDKGYMRYGVYFNPVKKKIASVSVSAGADDLPY